MLSAVLGIESPGERHPAGRTRMGSEARSGLEDRGRMGLVVPYATPLPFSPYLLSFHSRKTRRSIKSRFSLGALRNIKDNQPTISLISIKYEPSLEKEARAEKTQRVRRVGLKPCVSL